jgi:magnesium-transporting ATPase (P-type)
LFLSFGENKVPDPPRKTYLELLIETFKDTTIIVLCVAAVLSLSLSFIHLKDAGPCEDFDPDNEVKESEDSSSEFLEALAILVAVVIVSNVTALNDYSKEKQFRKLNEASRDTNIIQVIRGGKHEDLQTQDLVVGDVVLLTAGDKAPADGLFISGQALTCDESSLTGEPDLKKKFPGSYMKAGAIIAEGFGQMLVTAVGEHTDSGKAQALLKASVPDPTPLQTKLDKMATQIGVLHSICCQC